MKISIDPHKKLFKWGPIDGRPIYPDYWWPGFIFFARHFVGWPDTMAYFEKEKILVVLDDAALYAAGEENLKRSILPDRAFVKSYAGWQKAIQKFRQTIRKICAQKLASLSQRDLHRSFLLFEKSYEQFWDFGLLAELANYGDDRMLERELRKKIKDEEDFHYAFERLSAPEKLSFYQKEEIELLSLAILRNRKMLESGLRRHQRKYFWILNSYHHTRVLPIGYFEKILASFTPEEAKRKIELMRRIYAQMKRDKKDVLKKFRLSKDVEKIAQRLSFCVWWQDARKAFIFQANHVIDLFLREAARRHVLDFHDLHYYVADEIRSLLQSGKKVSGKEIVRRKENFLMLYRADQKGVQYVSGTQAQRFMQPYLKKNHDSSAKEFKGIVVNRGKVCGTARIIHSPQEISKMKKGDILVAAMTSPDYILALKKAAAVVTDEGGMTCHAAIVSRELGIPGIVGTRFATQLLKDGMMVEVDAYNGIVKILEKQ